MSNAVLHLIGGPLCGLYLPVTPGVSVPPFQLVAYSPFNTSWASYVDRRRKRGATDVYKIRAGVRLSVARPRDGKIVDMFYGGILTPEMVEQIEQIERERRQEEAQEE